MWIATLRMPNHLQSRLGVPPLWTAFRAKTFAVGTALAGGPPHRSQRALLTRIITQRVRPQFRVQVNS